MICMNKSESNPIMPMTNDEDTDVPKRRKERNPLIYLLNICGYSSESKAELSNSSSGDIEVEAEILVVKVTMSSLTREPTTEEKLMTYYINFPITSVLSKIKDSNSELIVHEDSQSLIQKVFVKIKRLVLL
uniref:Uncharacterized protein n=1 Tax=Lepeophtheirus salmonis TaxID=72036 RepID=A0A0K2TDE8_LEPSM